jgi:beta-xylosidase
VRVENPANVIDPDIFWDTDGKAHLSLGAGIYINGIDTETGAAGESTRVWNGTGDRDPEGPHIFHKDDHYYLLIGEGGTKTNHSAVIARGDAVLGPYYGYENNPILTAKNTDEYFQTLGHADIFQGAVGNWWGVALATRSGPEWKVYPMGRETVLLPVTWEDGEWPEMDRLVHGTMEGPLPPVNKDIPGDGHWITDPDVVDFKPGSVLPKHWPFWRPPKLSLFEISPKGHRNTLRITPSSSNLSAAPGLIPQEDGLGFIARRQSNTIFDSTIDVSFSPKALEEEAGVALFLTHTQSILISASSTCRPAPTAESWSLTSDSAPRRSESPPRLGERPS